MPRCIDVRWPKYSESSERLKMPAHGLRRFDLDFPRDEPPCFVSVVPSHTAAAGHEWMVMVADWTTSALRFNFEESGVVETPLVTVRRYWVALADKCKFWVGNSSTVSSAAGNGE